MSDKSGPEEMGSVALIEAWHLLRPQSIRLPATHSTGRLGLMNRYADTSLLLIAYNSPEDSSLLVTLGAGKLSTLCMLLPSFLSTDH